MGTHIAALLELNISPYATKGHYKADLLSAFDYEGVVNGAFTLSNEVELQRQILLLQLLYDCQGSTNRFDSTFWRPLEKNENFLFELHRIASLEKYEHRNELLLRAMKYAWKHSGEDGIFDYNWIISELLNLHFEEETIVYTTLVGIDETMNGKSAKDTYFEQYESVIFRQPFHDREDMLVLIDCNKEGSKHTLRYLYINETIEEKTAVFNTNGELIRKENEALIPAITAIFAEFKKFTSKEWIHTLENIS